MTDKDMGRIVVWIDPDLKAIVPDFFDFRRKDVAALTELVARGDFVRIRAIGHNLKGAGGGYGFDAISEIGQSLEQAAERHAADEVHGCLRALTDYLARVEVRYE